MPAPNTFNFLRESGTFDVSVLKTEKRNSKAGNPMLVVTMATEDGREINSYFVATNQYGLQALSEFKSAIGVSEDTKAEGFVGKKCSIVVGFQDPNKTGGKLFTQVEKYLPVRDADPGAVPGELSTEQLPF